MNPESPSDTNAVIQGLWIGDTLSLIEQLSIASFLKNGHAYQLYLYDEVKNVPQGVVLKNANDILPFHQVFKYKDHESYAAFANMFRYKLLLERGGYWADTDIICLKRFDFDGAYVFAEEKVSPDVKRICNNIIKAPAGSEIMQFCYETSAHKNRDQLRWGETGPELLSLAVDQFRRQDDVRPYKTFNPIHWWEWEHLMQGELALRLKMDWRIRNSYAIHFWNEMWRRNGADKNKAYPLSSLFERLKRKYL